MRSVDLAASHSSIDPQPFYCERAHSSASMLEYPMQIVLVEGICSTAIHHDRILEGSLSHVVVIEGEALGLLCLPRKQHVKRSIQLC